MNAHSLAQHTILSAPLRHHSHSCEEAHSFSVTLSLNADRHRVFHALTVPEYMEAWIDPPGICSNQQIRISANTKTIRIDTMASHGLESIITGAYYTLRRSKLLFTWKRGILPDAPVSRVKVRLNGDFSRTTLHLSHAGLNSQVEYEWNRTFWLESLPRLLRLF